MAHKAPTGTKPDLAAVPAQGYRDVVDAGQNSDFAHLVVFGAKGIRWALPLASVETVHPVVEVAAVPGAPDVVAGVIDVGGRTVPVFDLSRRLDGKPGDFGIQAKLVIGRTSRRPFAILAEDVEGVISIPASSISDMAALVPGAGHINEVASSPEGLIYIHDPETMLTDTEETDLGAALERVRA